MKHFFCSAIATLLMATSACAQEDGVIPPGFESHMIEASDLSVHAVMEDGIGDPLVLIHGWPQDWSEWRHVMPDLAENYRVIAIDLRGVGKTEVATGGFEKTVLADDLIALLDALNIEQAHIAGHDIGGIVAYTVAADHPERALSVSILDVPLPGSQAYAIIAKDPRAWHFGLHATADLPEQIIAGDQRAYFEHFYTVLAYDKDAITEDDLDRFVTAYEGETRLSAGFGFYRGFASDAEHFSEASLAESPPILLLGGEVSVGGLLEMTAAELKEQGARSVETVVIPKAGHWIAEENPEAVVNALNAFLSKAGNE